MLLSELIEQGAFTLNAIKDDEKKIANFNKVSASFDKDTIDVMRKTFFKGDNKLCSYRYMDKSDIEYSDTSKGEEFNVINALVKIDTDDNKLMFSFNGNIYKTTDAQIVKLSKDLSILSGLDNTLIYKNLIKAKDNFDKLIEAKRVTTFDKTELVRLFKEVLDAENAEYITKTDEWKITDSKTDKYQIVTDTYIKRKIEINVQRYQFTINKEVKPAYVLGEFDDYKMKIKLDKFFTVQRAVSHIPDDLFRKEYLRVWHKVFTIKQNVEIFQVLMSHWVWQVKRRLYDMPTIYELMLAIHGEQGIGKSWVCRKIFGPIFGDLYDASITLDRLCDERNAKILMDNYILNIEELTQSGSNDTQAMVRNGAAGKLKTIITEARGSYRPMRSNESERIRINASLLSNANFHIYDIVNDESGMRRFFEFNCSQPKDNSVHLSFPSEVQFLYDNANRFIKSIDENLERGYWVPSSKLGLEISEIQNSYIKRNSFTEFLSYTYEIGKIDLPNEEWVTKKIINELYKAYLLEQGTDVKFAVKNLDSKILDMFGIDCVKKLHNQNVYRLVKIDKDSDLSLDPTYNSNSWDKKFFKAKDQE